MSSFNANLKNRIINLLDDEDEPISYKEFIASITKIFDELADKPASKKREKKSKLVVKKTKREPSAYNIFYKAQAAKLKEMHFNSRELMAKIAELWQAEKLLVKTEEMDE
jgi:hypothetical protein